MKIQQINGGLKNHRFYSRLVLLRQFIHIMGVRPAYVIFPITLSFIVAGFEAVSLGLLTLLAKGMATNKYEFITEMPIFKYAIPPFERFLSFCNVALSHNKAIFLFLVCAVFASLIIKNILSYIASLLFAYRHSKFKNNIYNFVFKRFLTFGKLFFDRTNQGYINLVLLYSEGIMYLFNAFERTVKDFFILLAYFATMFMISYKLTFITLFLFPVLYFTLRLVIKRIEEVAALENSTRVELGRRVFNILTCIPLIKAYSKEEKMQETYAAINDRLKKLDFRRERIKGLVSPIEDLIITGGLLIIISVVALLLAKDRPAEVSIFIVFFYAARKALPMFGIFSNLRLAFASARPTMKEMTKIFDDKEKFFVVEGKRPFRGLDRGVEFRHLRFSYTAEVEVLKDISFSIEKGKITAIVGSTGAGKTTVISLLMRFYDCPPSSIFVDGIDIREFTLSSLRSHIALVSQEIFLFNDTIRNNITFGLDTEVREEELMNSAKRARLYDFIMRLPDKFNTEVGDRGIKLSGGERQRIAIARALLKGGEIFILDEATSSLDSKTEQLIQEAIDEAVRDRTSIVIAHRLSTIKHADKIVVLENGMVSEQGALDELLDKRGKFYEYWEAQKFY